MSEPNRPVYVARPSGWHPRNFPGRVDHASFSVGVGEGKAGAVYRVGGKVEDFMAVDELTERLVAWLNDPDRADVCPVSLPCSGDASAKVVLTTAGMAAGFMPIERYGR